MKNITLILLILLLVPCASAATITDGFNGSVTVTDASVSYNETVSLVEASPDWIEITITGDYPEYAAGVPYLNLKAYYELNGDAEDSTTVHDGTHTGTTAGTYDGIDDCTSIPAHSDFNFSSDFTISAQVDVDDFDQTVAVIDGESYAFRVGRDRIPYFEMMDDTGLTETLIGSPRGSSYYILSLTEFNGEVYAGLYSGYVYRYSSGSWVSCGQVGPTTSIFSLCVYNGNLYAGTGNGSGLCRLYRFDGGTTWTLIGTINADGNYLDTMCVYDGKLYCGDDLGKVWTYDGSTIADVGTPGTTYTIRAMVVFKDKLYASGSGDGIVYRYDGGTTWTSIGDIGAAYHINDLCVYDGVMYATLSGSTLSGYVYKWDGVGTTTWSSCGRLGSSTENRALCVYNGQLYGTCYSNGYVYRYNGGTSWTGEQMGSCTRVYCLTTWDGKLLAGCYNAGYVYSIGIGEAIYGTALTADTDTYLTAVRSGSTVTFYQDTTSKGTATASFALDTSRNILIGKSYGTSQPTGSEETFDGEIHKVGFWSDDVEVASIISGEVGMFMKPSCDTAWVPYEGSTQLISIGTILDGVTFKNTDGGPNGVTIVERFLYDVTTSNEINADGNYEVDVALTTSAATSDGKIRIEVPRVFTSATVTGDSTEITYGDGYLLIDTDSIAAGAYDFHIEATYDIGANSYSPSSSSISMIAMSDDSQIFTVTTNDDESHDFVWYVDKVEVESNSGLTSSYTYESGAYGSDTIKVVIDDSVVHTWNVVNGLNTTATTKSLTSLNENLSLEFKSISDYKGFDKIFAADTENTSSLLDAAFMPVNSYWADDDLGLGVWFYPVLIILLAGGVYIKTKQLETTSITILILTMLIAAPATAGTIHVPTAFLWMMYLLAAFSVLGVFAGLLFRRG